MTFSFSCETVNPSRGHAQLEKRAAAVELRGVFRKPADCTSNWQDDDKVFRISDRVKSLDL
jgi:hypothetical protein